VDELYINFEKVGIRQEHKEHCSAYLAFSNRRANQMQPRVTIMAGIG